MANIIMATSPDRGTFQLKNQLKRAKELGQSEESIKQITDIFRDWEETRAAQETANEWKIDNMEYDLRSTKWCCDKVKASEAYAQNLYAAICNNEFTKNDVIPILMEKRWSASWRSAGGIVANMTERGDYIDWYCSGIKGPAATEEVFNNMTIEQQERIKFVENNFVSESIVTDEIRQDLLKLRWIVIDQYSM